MSYPTTASVRLLAGEREPVRVATTANIALQGLQTVDGVVLAVNDRVLVKDQTDGRDNGIWTASEGKWYRASDANFSRAIDRGVTVQVQQGTAHAGKAFRFDTLSPEIGTDVIVIAFYLSSTFAVDAAALVTFELDRAANTIRDLIDNVANSYTDYPSRAVAVLSIIPTIKAYVRTGGYASVGDGGGALYVKVGSEPAHGGKFQSADDAWWEIVIDQPGLNVNMFGAVGDGVTDDRAAFTAMQAVTGGTIHCLAQRYNLEGWTPSFDKMNLSGARKPKFNPTDTDLLDGTVLIGYMFPRVQNASVTNLGVKGELYVDPAIGTTGERIHARNLACLGEHDGFSDGLAASHGFTFEGYDETDVADIEAARHYYGVVCKSRNGTVTRVRGRLNYGCTVFAKSDTPDFAGFVANAQVNNIIVSDVQATAHASNTVHDAVQVYGSTLPIFAVRVDGVASVFGKTALTVIGNGMETFAANVRASSIRGSGGQRAYALEGTTFDCGYVDLFSENTALIPVFIGSAANFSLGTTTVINSDAGLVYQDVFAITAGATGTWSVVNVRGGPVAGMLLNYDKALVTGGTHSGNVLIAGEQPPVMGTGWVSGPPGYASLETLVTQQGYVHLTGVVQADPGRAGFVCTIAAGARPAGATDIACSVSGTPGAARVYSDGSIQMLSTVADADLIAFAGMFKL